MMGAGASAYGSDAQKAATLGTARMQAAAQRYAAGLANAAAQRGLNLQEMQQAFGMAQAVDQQRAQNRLLPMGATESYAGAYGPLASGFGTKNWEQRGPQVSTGMGALQGAGGGFGMGTGIGNIMGWGGGNPAAAPAAANMQNYAPMLPGYQAPNYFPWVGG
jgi:hypothetical protein